MECLAVQSASVPSTISIDKWDGLLPSQLPPRLQELEKLIGLAATMRLVDQFGGVRVYIPSRPKPDHPYVQIIGFENLVKLSEEYAGNGLGLRIALPSGAGALIALRDMRIQRECSCKSVRELAQQYGLHERQITRILVKANAPAARSDRRKTVVAPKKTRGGDAFPLPAAIARHQDLVGWMGTPSTRDVT